MSDSKTDKRARSRIPLRVPVKVRSKEMVAEDTAVTRDLSISGVFLYTDRRVTEGSKLEIILILPSELGLGEKQWACCQASVVRVEDGEGHGFGVAGPLHRLDMLPEIPT